MLGIVLHDPTLVRKVKLELGEDLDKKRKIYQHNGKYIIPTTLHKLPVHLDQFETIDLTYLEEHPSIPSLPSKYSVYPPLLLFPSDALPKLKQLSTTTIASFLDHPQIKAHNLTHVAANQPIPDHDIVRHPDLIPLVGDFGPAPTPQSLEQPSQHDFSSAFWCHAVQNRIHQVWAPRYTMFSRGNIKEKARVLQTFSAQEPTGNTDVVDLYCGIGYFVFSYASHAPPPRRIFCWELNPWSIEGLRRGAELNKFNVRIIAHNERYEPRDDDFIVVFHEDNREAAVRLARIDDLNVSHVNMGLLPHAHDAFRTAVELSRNGTVLHVHENVAEQDIEQWTTDTVQKLGQLSGSHVQLVDMSKIKTFSPGVWHVCGDYKIVK